MTLGFIENDQAMSVSGHFTSELSITCSSHLGAREAVQPMTRDSFIHGPSHCSLSHTLYIVNEW